MCIVPKYAQAGSSNESLLCIDNNSDEKKVLKELAGVRSHKHHSTHGPAEKVGLIAMEMAGLRVELWSSP